MAVTAAVWVIGAQLMSTPEPKENSARWPFGLGTIDEVPARFPPSKIDATAHRVNAIAQRLTATDPLRTAIQSHLSDEIARSNDHVEAPPAAIRRFLDGHVAAIDELRTTLAGGTLPRWAIDINQEREPSVDLAEQLWLVRVLAADALDHHGRGDDATAWRDAETAWILAQGLWAQPDLTARLIALSGTRVANAVAAKLTAPAPPWHGKLLAFEADRELAAALQFDAWRATTEWNRAVARPAGDATRPWRGAAGVMFRGVRAKGASKYAASMRAAAEEIARTHSCGGARSHSEVGYAEAVRSRLDRFHIEREAVAKLLALKEQRAQSGAWPESMPTVRISFCGEDSWRYRREANGSMSLLFVKPIEEEVRRLALLSFSFRYPK
jgi:hypothetical protein